MALAATGGLVLIADALRVRLGLTRARPAPWRQLTDAPTRGPGFPWRAVAGVALIGWVAFLGVGLAGPYVGGNGVLQVLVTLLVVGGAAVAIGTPILIGSLARTIATIRTRARGRAAAVRGAPARSVCRRSPSCSVKLMIPPRWSGWRVARSMPCGPGWLARPS